MPAVRVTLRDLALIVLVTGAVGAAVLPGQAAQAAAVPAPAGDPAAAVVSALGDRTAGSYLSGPRIVVTVTDDAGEQQVRAAGLQPRRVARSGRVLAEAQSRLEATARIPGTAWAADPVSDQVVVSVDQTVGEAQLARLTAVASQLGDRVRVTRVAGRLAPLLAGGDAIYGGQFRCSLGFNVRSGSSYAFLTAGHCGNLAGTWYADGAHRKLAGTVVGSSFPGNDYALVRYTGSVKHPGDVDLYGRRQDIATAGTAAVGQSVQRTGSTSHVHSGTVTAVDATVNYAEGTVTGLIRTSVCAESGDSGGALFAGTVALGLTSGGIGDCGSGGTTYFQPVDEALAHFGVSIY